MNTVSHSIGWEPGLSEMGRKKSVKQTFPFLSSIGLLTWELLSSPPLQELSNCEPKHLLPSSTSSSGWVFDSSN